MPAITVQLDDEANAFLTQRVAEGRYPDEASALKSGIRALQYYEREHEEELQLLHYEIQKGIDSGPGTDAAEVFARLRSKHGLPPRIL